MGHLEQQRELLNVERRFWNAIKKKDAQGTARISSSLASRAQGLSAIDQKTMAKLTEEGKWELEQYSFDEANAQVRFLTDDVAIVAYKVNERVAVDGETLPIEANDSSVWVRRNGEWLCALHTESLAGDPYGRDRVPAS